MTRKQGRAPVGAVPHFVFNVAPHYVGEECLFWPFLTQTGAYPRVKVGNRMRGAHLVICEIVNGPSPSPKHDARHTCGNGHLGCVNPKHLVWGTRAQNVADMRAHGTTLFGEKNPHHKLSDHDVQRIRDLRGTQSRAEIAKQFGVHPMHVSRIHSGRQRGFEPGHRPMQSRNTLRKATP